MPISLRELTPAEMPAIYPLIHQLNPWMGKAQFTRSLKAMLPLGYRVLAAFDGRQLVGCAGFWVGMRFWCGKQFDIDNVIVDETCRKRGIGKKMSVWLEKKAAELGCDLMVLDSYAGSAHAHRFYMQQGFALTGYHFTKMPGDTPLGKLPFRKD